MQQKRVFPVLSFYLLTTSFIFFLVAQVFLQTIEDIHGVQKLVLIEMKEFSHSSNEIWRLLNILNSQRMKRMSEKGRNRNHRRPAIDYREQDLMDEYEDRRLAFPEPLAVIGNIDGTSVGSTNGAEKRKIELEEKILRKEEKKKSYAKMCLNECQQRSESCSTGPPGPAGKRGRNGNPGFPGTHGMNGASGIAVAVSGGCIKCPIGKRGPRGERGATGEKGTNGKDGLSVKAVIGAAGPQGDMGYPGYPGFPGERGPRGPQGGNANLYNNPPGPVGLPGKQGYQGEQGPSGFVYNTALVGPVGFSGRNGLNGRAGETGVTGLVGPPGRDGNYCECPLKSKRNQLKSA